MPAQIFRVSYRDFQGTRHAVEVVADSLFEAGVLALSAIPSRERDENLGSSTRLDIQVIDPRDTETVSVGQLHRWLEAPATAAERATRQELKKLLAS